MGFGVEGIAAASVQMSMAKVQSAYSTTLLKKTMDAAESQAVSLIEDMAAGVPVPSEYTFDVRV